MNDTLVAAQTACNIATKVFKEGDVIDGFSIVHMTHPGKLLEFDEEVYMLSGEQGEVIKQKVLMTYDMANAIDMRLTDSFTQQILEDFVDSFLNKIKTDIQILMDHFIDKEGIVEVDRTLLIREPLNIFEDTNLHRRRKKGFYGWMEAGLGVCCKEEQLVVPTETCGECGGSGKYVGFNVVENCKRCQGTGTIV